MKNKYFTKSLGLFLCTLFAFIGCNKKESEIISPQKTDSRNEILANSDPSQTTSGLIVGKEVVYKTVTLTDLRFVNALDKPMCVSIIWPEHNFYYIEGVSKYYGSNSIADAKDVDFAYYTDENGESFLGSVAKLPENLAVDYPHKNESFFKIVDLTPWDLWKAFGDNGKKFIEDAVHKGKKGDNPNLFANHKIKQGDILFCQINDKTKGLIQVFHILRNPNRVTLGLILPK